MASGGVASQHEVEFRRRWHQAHVRRLESDLEKGRFEDWLPSLRASAPEALEIRDRLASSGDLERFRADQQTWAFKNDVGFKGHSGAQLINSLVKRTDDRPSLTRLLISGLTTPKDRESAVRKIEALVEHINRIKVGAHPAPLNVAFMLPYFWALEQPRVWPIFWPNDRKYLAASPGTKFSGSPSERYIEFVDLVAELDEDCERFARASSWWAQKRDKRPVFLDPVLVDRCAYGMDAESIPPESLRENALALLGIARYLGESLADDVSDAVGYSCELAIPSPDWKSGRPRSDLWVNWRPEGSKPALRLWVNHRVTAIGVVPGHVRRGWYDEAREVRAAHEVEGFTLMATQGASQGKDVGFYGEGGSFIYGRWYPADRLADLDLRVEVVEVASAARPLLDALIRRATESPPPESSQPTAVDLAEAVTEFRRDAAYPTAHDERQKARQPRLREILRPGNLATTNRAELRKVWTGAYGGAGVQSHLGRTVRDADEVEYERILGTLEFLCWGDGDDADRIDTVLTDADYKVNGLGETVIFKLLAICYPDRYLCVYPYSGEQGKLRMVRALNLPEPPIGATRGQKHVESNKRLWERLAPHFPGDPWGMMCFLYWYIDYLDREDPPIDEPDPLDAAATDLLVDTGFPR